MTKENYIQIFNESHPGFFDKDYIKAMPDDRLYEEMFMYLPKFQSEIMECTGHAEAQKESLESSETSEISFGLYSGDKDKLIEAVKAVDSTWPAFFKDNARVYCGYLNGEIASFCLIEDMGTHVIDGKTIKVGGPGCVGTVPAFRKKGIGLEMVRRATLILRDEGYDYGYIHYTGVAHWYARLGYETKLKWGNKGFI